LLHASSSSVLADSFIPSYAAVPGREAMVSSLVSLAVSVSLW